MNDQKITADARYVSRLTRETFALILAGGQGSRLYELTTWRAKPALYFGGKFRIIDFPLSNCLNSGIRRIGVLTQYKAHSLIRHLVRGWSWFQAGAGDKEFVEILPASQRVGGEWYRGTADAVYQNLDIIRTQDPRFVLILSGDHIYKMDYGPFLAAHAASNADMTICCIEVPLEEAAGQFGVMTVDESGRIIGFDEKPEKPNPVPGKPDVCLASMGNYLFNTQFLYEQVIKDADTPGTQHDFGKDVIPRIIDDYQVHAYAFNDPATGEQAYWRRGVAAAEPVRRLLADLHAPDTGAASKIRLRQARRPRRLSRAIDGIGRLRRIGRAGAQLAAVFRCQGALLQHDRGVCHPSGGRHRPRLPDQARNHRPRRTHRARHGDWARSRSGPRTRLSGHELRPDARHAGHARAAPAFHALTRDSRHR